QTPTPTSCATLGIDTVRVVLFDGDTAVAFGELVANCEDGAFLSQPVLLPGTYEAQVQAVSAAGEVLGEGIRESRRVFAGETWVLAATDFTGGVNPTEGELRATWSIDGFAADATGCADLGADAVDLVFLDSTGAVIPDATVTAPCTDGSLAVLLDPGTYSVSLEAVDTVANEIVQMGITEMFSVVAGGVHELNGGNPVDFQGGFNPMGSDASITLDWTLGTQLADEVTCPIAGVGRIDVVLYDSNDVGLVDGVVVTTAECFVGLIDTTTTPTIRAGSYQVVVEFHEDRTTDSLLTETDPVEATVVASQNIEIGSIDYRLPESVVAFELVWQSPTSVGDVTCGDSTGPSSIGWSLDRDGSFFIESTTVDEEPCADVLDFSQTTIGFTVLPGDYDLFFEGFEPPLMAGGAPDKRWSIVGECFATLAEVGDLAIATCLTEYQ
ncbi:MAG: hypothetical protein AAGG08_19180, partial [Actinomycetota bacterium]